MALTSYFEFTEWDFYICPVIEVLARWALVCHCLGGTMSVSVGVLLSGQGFILTGVACLPACSLGFCPEGKLTVSALVSR